MRKTMTVLASLCLAAALGPKGSAQELGAQGPPKILQIYVEEVKPGHGPAHEKLEAAWSHAFAEAKWPVHYLALTSMTGVNVAWYLSGYPSFEAMEKADQEMEKQSALQATNAEFTQKDGEHLSGGRAIIARLQEDMSHIRPIPLAQARYFRVTRTAVRVGRSLEFRESNKILREAFEKSGIKTGFAMFSVVGGYGGPTYLAMTPMKTLAEMDEMPAGGKSIRDAMGEETFKTYLKLLSESVAQSENLLFSVNSKMSYPPQAWIDSEPGFWKPAAPAKAPAAKAKAEPAKK
jgi:hypothetical protein